MDASTSEQKVLANIRNAAKSTGPEDTSLTRLNAAKHGLLCEGVSELDDAAGFEGTLRCLTAELNPQGELESFLVRRIALGMVRLRRAAVMEAEFIRSELHPEVRQNNALTEIQNSLSGPIISPGKPARISSAAVVSLTDKFQRYETAIENKLYRAIHQLERQQRMRQGELVARQPHSTLPSTAMIPNWVRLEIPLKMRSHESRNLRAGLYERSSWQS